LQEQTYFPYTHYHCALLTNEYLVSAPPTVSQATTIAAILPVYTGSQFI